MNINYFRILCFKITLLCSTFAFADFGIATFVRGKVYVNRGSDKAFQLKKNAKVYQDDIIETAKKSFVKIKFSDNSTFSLGQSSKIVMQKLQVEKTKSIELIQGYVRSKFDKTKSHDHKLQVKSKSAILGIRGTEFCMIYNPKNNVTTTIGYSGDVEFSRIKDDGTFLDYPVHIEEGQFSSTKSRLEKVTEPIKLSPAQFETLKSNDDLSARDKKVKVSKNIVVPKLKTEPKSQIVPTQLLGPGYNQVIANLQTEQRPGGYIDLDSGLYIEPSENAEFDYENGVYKVDKEFGGFDPETGEYIPPLGILLHPLKGFVVASDLLASASKMIREKTVDVTSGVISGASKVGSSVYDGAKNVGSGIIGGVTSVGETIEENTGVVGKTVGKGVRYASDTTVNAVKKVGEVAINTVERTSDKVSSLTVDTMDAMANNMNKYLNNGFFHDNARKISSLPYINQLDIQINNELSFTDIHQFKVYDQIENIIKEESFRNEFHFSAQFKKTFYKKLFIRPRFFTNRIDYLKDDDSFDQNERYMHRYGLDIGVMGKVNRAIVQSYFYIDYGNFFREESLKGRYNEYLVDKRFGFSKIIIGSENITSKFNYFYTEYHSNTFDKGHINNFKLSEIINLENKNYIDFSLYWSDRARSKSGENATVRGIKLEYLYQSLKGNFNVSLWGDYQAHNDDLYDDTRGEEELKEFGVKFSRGFGKFFATNFKIYSTHFDSDDSRFDNNNQTFSLAFSGSY